MVLLSGLVVSCNKDQKAVKSISNGIWYLTEITTNGNAYQPITDSTCITYSFITCKLKNEDACSGNIDIMNLVAGIWGGQGYTNPFTYKIYEKGTKIEFTIEWMKPSGLDHVEIIDADIIELISDRLVFSYEEAGETIKKTLLHSTNSEYDKRYDGCL